MENGLVGLTPEPFVEHNSIMTDWLKSIGSRKKPVSEWRENYVGFRKDNKPGIKVGDRLFLYAPGRLNMRIFALAEAVGNAEPDPDFNPGVEGSCYWRLAVRYP